MPEKISLIIPANNEEHFLPSCLEALLAQTDTDPLQVIVAANGCSDGTVSVAASFEDAFAAKGWMLTVLDIPEGSKIGALNQADDAADGAARIYLDADVICDPDLIAQLRAAFAKPEPRYVTGTLQIAPMKSWVTRAYANFWRLLPFVQDGAVGAGLFAVNPAGRARWGAFPDIISDDTFVRLSFAPSERIEVPAYYHWPMIEGLRGLIKVRQRQDTGVTQVQELFPELATNDVKSPLSKGRLLKLILAAPLGFLVYMVVHVAVRLRAPSKQWTRGR